MLYAIFPVSGVSPEQAAGPALQNPAVARCVEAWAAAYKMHRKRKIRDKWPAEKAACQAYRHALPPLIGYQNICDFIACTGYGILIGVMEEEATKLLYAAQVALGTIAPEAKTHKRTTPVAAYPTPSPAVFEQSLENKQVSELDTTRVRRE